MTVTKEEARAKDITEVVVVAAPGLEASKVASLAFQAGALLALRTAARSQGMEDMESFSMWMALNDWDRDGARTVVRQAKTAATFDRVAEEVPGVPYVDHGEEAVVLWIAWPLPMSKRPKILNSKKVPLL